MTATLFEWGDNRELLVVFQEEGGQALVLKDADGYPTLLGKFGTLLPDWQRKSDLLATEGLTLTDYFNRVEEAFP